MNEEMFIKENNKVRMITEKKAILQAFKKKREKHLCAECVNMGASLCEKVYDHQKKNISEYAFIPDGYQIIMDGVLEKFVVSSCTNFVSSKNLQFKTIDDINNSEWSFYEKIVNKQDNGLKLQKAKKKTNNNQK